LFFSVADRHRFCEAATSHYFRTALHSTLSLHPIADQRPSVPQRITIIFRLGANAVAAVVILLMFGAVIVMVRRIDEQRENQAIPGSGDSSEMEA
jgi:hypothetical protein